MAQESSNGLDQVSARPNRTVLALLAVALVVALVLAPRIGGADWDPATFLTLLLIAVISDLGAIATPATRVKLSASFLAIVTATVFLGPAPGVALGVLTILGGWIGDRYPAHYLLNNLATYAWFPLLAGGAFHEAVETTGVTQSDPGFYLLVFLLFGLALVINFTLVAGYAAYVERSSFLAKARHALVPILPSELASAILTVGIALAYAEFGVPALALFGAVLLIFQRLVGALVVSEQRAEELELRANQLAGFQVGMLSALLRTLDLRDRMTARHSAAVARYTREVAAAAGLSEEEQELAHTAALLHDIGKFALPDRILKTGAKLTEEDWALIRKHPAEGCRIVSGIDGYQPVGEIILAHHERPDGLGYPNELSGDEIPEIARIISVADVYDVMTARDSYKNPVSPEEAIAELWRVAGTQLDGRYVELFVEILEGRDLAYRHGEDADFEAELALDKRVHDYVNAARWARSEVPAVVRS